MVKAKDASDAANGFLSTRQRGVREQWGAGALPHELGHEGDHGGWLRVEVLCRVQMDCGSWFLVHNLCSATG